MAFSYHKLFFGGTKFCCCLPVRMGVIVMSILGMFFGGLLSIILWYEVASSGYIMTSGEKGAFVIGSLVETILLTASILGFVGAIVRKQSFVEIYAYIIYTHFLLNIAIAAFLLYEVNHFSQTAAIKACQDTIKNSDAQSQCDGLLKVAKSVYFVIATVVLLVEMYGAFIVARYVNQLKTEKRKMRTSRMMGSDDSGFQLAPKGGRYSVIPEPRPFIDTPVPLGSINREYNPYEEIRDAAGPSAVDRPPPPMEIGYGGGSWTHGEITEEEKARLKREDGYMEPEPESDEDEDEMERRRQEIKSVSGPLPPKVREMDDLPRYTLSDNPVGGRAAPQQ
ncbi:hypothetical protein BD779DRAFT_1435349 [Infundibulicybe gibba]|nr:hypothetical protein BD779DRAFT_1435349 [Infundibulicybe gibba]